MESPVSRLASLPAEILLLVFRHSLLSDLKELRRCCKSFAALAEPILYEGVVIVPDLESKSILRKIAEHPSLKYHVRRLLYDNRWGIC